MQEIVISGSGIHSSFGEVSDKHHSDSHHSDKHHSVWRPDCAAAGARAAVEAALEQAKRTPEEVDALLLACPSTDFGLSAEALRSSLGAAGWSWDLDIASSTATFGIRVASELLERRRASVVVVVRPEFPPFRPVSALDAVLDAAHAPTGDACSAIVLESGAAPASEFAYTVLGTRLQRGGPSLQADSDTAIARHIRAHLWELDLAPEDLRRMWIHQKGPEASLDIARGVLGRDADHSEAPVLVDEATPRGSAGSLTSFHLHKRDLWEGEIGLLCSIGTQGSIGSTLLERWQH
ncbi:MAG: hypothetical protein JRG96_16405 [Deltaproteobacteria bacterium]|nr:hypothetical protein [Deltaproteobacteria bacterium]